MVALPEASAARLALAGDEGAIAELARVTGARSFWWPAMSATWVSKCGRRLRLSDKAESAGVDEDPHASRAAANASSLSSSKSSISNVSIDASTGAAAS